MFELVQDDSNRTSQVTNERGRERKREKGEGEEDNSELPKHDCRIKRND
jgi:hypothetical protein